MIEIKKERVIALLVVSLLLAVSIPSVIAPIWYGSGDDTGLVGRWSCEGNFNDSSGQGNNKEVV